MTTKNIMNNLFDKHDARCAEIKRIEARIEKLKSKLDSLWNKSGWVDMIVKPLAKELAKQKGMYYQIYGPFGLDCETTIYLTARKNASITENDTYSLTLVPNYQNSVLRLNCVRQRYTARENVIALPDNLEEIMGLLEFQSAEEG